MPKKVYISGNLLTIEESGFETQKINVSRLDYKIDTNDKFSLYDGITKQNYKLGIFSDVQKKDGTLYASILEFTNFLDSVINTTNTAESVRNLDLSNNQALNTTFGDAIVGNRVPSLASQFRYGLILGDSNPVSNDAIVTAVNGGAVNLIGGELVLNTGANSAGAASIQSNGFVRYLPGFEMYALFSFKFTAPAANSTQYAGLFDSQNGYYLGFDGTDFVFVRRKAGTDFKAVIDVSTIFDGKFDPTKFNVYYIKYGFLGVNPIKLLIVKPSGGFQLVHTIEFPNTSNTIHTDQTFLPLRAEVTNSGNTSDLQGKSGSVSTGIVNGNGVYPASRLVTKGFAVSVTSGTTLLAVFRNKTVFNSIINRIVTQLLMVSTSSEGTKTVSIRLISNPNITNSPTWADIEAGRSVMEVSVDATIDNTTGREMITFELAKGSQIFEQLRDLQLTLRAGEWASIEVVTTGSSDINYTMRWEEQF